MAVEIMVRKNQKVELPAPLSVKEALQQLHLPAETYHFLRDGVLISEEETLKDGDVIKLIPIISGG